MINKIRGFTVLETLVAVAIVALVIGGVVSSIRTGLLASINAKDQVTAFYLAQEAIEVIRNKRDTNILALSSGGGGDWLKGIYPTIPPASCWPGGPCIVAVDASDQPMSVTGCGSAWGSCQYLQYDPTLNVYGYNNGWPVSRFKREVQVTPISSNREVLLTVRITWMQGVLSREFKTSTLLTNWF